MSLPVRLFISYSHEDATIVARLKTTLKTAGAEIWVDHENLRPGAPNWQLAIREGIEKADAVIYVASPRAARSPFVYDEIALARSLHRRVIPLWVDGASWPDSAPLGWGTTQYIDARSTRYAQAVARLLDALGLNTLVQAVKPALPAPVQSTHAPANSSAVAPASEVPRQAPPVTSVSPQPLGTSPDAAHHSTSAPNPVVQKETTPTIPHGRRRSIPHIPARLVPVVPAVVALLMVTLAVLLLTPGLTVNLAGNHIGPPTPTSTYLATVYALETENARTAPTAAAQETATVVAERQALFSKPYSVHSPGQCAKNSLAGWLREGDVTESCSAAGMTLSQNAASYNNFGGVAMYGPGSDGLLPSRYQAKVHIASLTSGECAGISEYRENASYEPTFRSGW